MKIKRYTFITSFLLVKVQTQEEIIQSTSFVDENWIIIVLLLLLISILMLLIWDKRQGYLYLGRIQHKMQQWRTKAYILRQKISKSKNQISADEALSTDKDLKTFDSQKNASSQCYSNSQQGPNSQIRQTEMLAMSLQPQTQINLKQVFDSKNLDDVKSKKSKSKLKKRVQIKKSQLREAENENTNDGEQIQASLQASTKDGQS